MSNEGEFNHRFEIIYRPESTLGTSNLNNNELQVYKDGHDFVVLNKKFNLDEVAIYDTSGRLIQQTSPKSKEYRLAAKLWNNGVYLLKIKYNTTTTTKRVIK